MTTASPPRREPPSAPAQHVRATRPPIAAGGSLLRARLGAALQQQRLRRGLTQGQLSELADLSLKYVGEIERGEANTTLDVVERLADVLGWDPMEAFGGVREPITEGVRILLIAEHERIGARARMMTTWLEALDPALHDAARSARLRSLPDSPRGADDSGSVPRASRRRHRS